MTMAMSAILPYRIRYAGGRDTCEKCGTIITKGKLQLAIIEQSLTDDCMEPKWYEQDCFFKHRQPASETLIDGFANLRITHQMEIRKLLSSGKSHNSISMDVDQPPEKKICSVQNNGIKSMLEEEIARQNKEFFEIRGKLKANTKREDRIAILKFNDQFVPDGNSEILNHLSDVLYFGAMKPCLICGTGQFLFKNSIYCCTGNVSEWSKCLYTVKTPNRVPVQIPEKYQAFLRGNFKVRERILNDIPKITDDDFALCVKQPLFGMEFVIVGETLKSKDEIQNKIKQMGGKLIEAVHANVAAIISNANEVTKMEQAMRDAKSNGIHVVPETFIDDVKNIDPLELMVMCDLSDWGRDPHERLPQMKSNDIKSSENEPGPSTGAIPKVQGMKWKYGSVVDPDSKLEEFAHVYDNGILKFDAKLDLVDIAANKNSFFKMQLLESDTEKKYWLFESKGRIATTIGSIHITPFSEVLEAIAAFKSLFFEKTGNEFGTKDFTKKPGKYNQMPVEHRIVKEKVLTHDKKIEYSISTSTLSGPVYKLIEMLFDIDVMESTWISFDLDLNKMPLGKINEQQIQSAIKLLKEMEVMLRKQNIASSKKMVELTNQFYSLIPHNFGVRRPPLLNTKEMINKKYEMLSDMQQMDITYNLLSDNIGEGNNPVDIHYRKLEKVTAINILDEECDEYNEIRSYVKNTTVQGHDLELLHVFKVSRHEETERFVPFERTPNRKLLFHGTRTTNVVGIMTNGLKLPVRTGMLGKAVYFSDAVSKSAGYCRNLSVNSSDNLFILLCEVALGHSEISSGNRRYTDFSHDNHPGIDSVRGLGQYSPRTNFVRPDGLIVPNGEIELRNGQDIRFRFNEYAVYEESRVKIRYLLQLKGRSNTGDPNIQQLLNLQNIVNGLLVRPNQQNPPNLPPG